MKKTMILFSLVLVVSLIITACNSQVPDSSTQNQTQPPAQQQIKNATAKQTAQQTVAVKSAATGDLKSYFMDVGQGDSTLFIRGDKAILVDCGSSGNIQYLKNLGVKSIALLIATHPHVDNIGGCDDILENFDVLEMWDNGQSHGSQAYKDYAEIAKNRNAAKTGMAKEIGGIKITVLSSNMGSQNVNENSVVAKISFGSTDFLMMADCESSCEGGITSDVSAEILKVGSNGGRASTALNFLKKVNPSVSIISVGANNADGDPAPITLEKLKETRIYRTDINGNIIITTDGTDYSVSTQK